MLHSLGRAFSAGSFGALMNSLFLSGMGQLGLTKLLGVDIAPRLSAVWLYPRIVWGGLWGFAFILPLARSRSIWIRALIISLAPTLMQLFWVFPEKMDKGVLGLELGLLTPLVVALVNGVWGITTVWWLKETGGDLA